MKRSACLIHNPVAGQGDSEADLQRIRELLEPDLDLDIQLTHRLAAVIADDGMLDITIVAPANAAAIGAGFHLLKTAQQGIAVERSDISYFRDRSVKVTTEPPQKVALDGELIGTTPVEIECIPGGLTILVPKLT